MANTFFHHLLFATICSHIATIVTTMYSWDSHMASYMDIDMSCRDIAYYMDSYMDNCIAYYMDSYMDNCIAYYMDSYMDNHMACATIL